MPDPRSIAPGSGHAPGRMAPSTQPIDTLKDGRAQALIPVLMATIVSRPPGKFAPATFPPDRLRDRMANTDLGLPASASWIQIIPPGHLSPRTARDNGIPEASSRTQPTVTYYVTKAGTASINNGGTSLAVRSTGTDGIVNSNVTNFSSIVSSPTATWTSDDVGHGINVGGITRLITGVSPKISLGSIVTNASSTITSAANDFRPWMVGQAVTGTNIAANTVVTGYTSNGSITINPVASGSGTQTLTFWAAATTRVSASTSTAGSATVFANGNAQTWTVGGAFNNLTTALATVSLGRNIVAGGDTIYVAPGVYRETIAVANNPDNRILNVIGDVDGTYTNSEPGEVRISSFSLTDMAGASGSPALDCQDRGNMAFSKLVFECGTTSNPVSSSAGSHDLSFTDCAMLCYGNLGGISLNGPVAPTPSNFLIERCTVVSWGIGISINGWRGADYDMNAIIRNSFIMSFANTGIQVGSAGGSGTAPNGLKVRGCTIFSSGGISLGSNTGVNPSTQIYDNLVVCGSATVLTINAGLCYEDYNRWLGAVPTNTAFIVSGGHSLIDNTHNLSRLGVYMGQERIWGALPKPFGSPMPDNQALFTGYDTSALPAASSTDMYGRQRPGGGSQILLTGTATSGTTTTLVDSTAPFASGSTYNGMTVKITGGTGIGQVKMIKSHTGTALTVYDTWQVIPDSTSTYTIYSGSPAHMCMSSNTNGATVSPTGAVYVAQQWVGFTATIVSGTGLGTSRVIASSLSTTWTPLTSFGTVDTTTVYLLFRQTDQNTVVRRAGAMEVHDTAQKETTLTDAGGVAWRLWGWADQTLRIPVDTSATTISINCSFDTDHGNTNKPTLSIVANAALGIAAQTVTAVGTAGSGTFETLILSAFTPTAKGWVEVRVAARSDLPTGRAVFDTVLVS